ncbi:amidohydrolase [Cupriavidus respiraculi]|uniref:M20 aminoacylase family protein n=1 Tax=Cupriavidus respiraculi TaxID=195930 RepID=UPI001C979733|nr:M20 aminoacylase family protein [Cupriavidus respiraculi]MBY4947531.1 amidohydrolase [Cupriavidus respiraculi]
MTASEASSQSYTEVADLLPLQAELAAIRHHLHQHPELAFKEHGTAGYIAGKLREWGYAVTTGIAGTGLVATLQAGSGPRRLGLRADMDALPIQEATGLAYASANAGVMHACGHDGHSAMLLGAALWLARTRRFSGTLHLIFQPAEERGFDSGGKAMVDAGLFDRFPCDMVFAMHNHPGEPQGHFMVRSGPFMAAGDRVFVKIKGVGGHAARPHQTVDPLVAASAVVMALQTIVSRNVDPNDPAVVTVGRLRAGDALNVIPAEAEIGISVRSFSPAVRALLKERICTVIDATAKAYGATAQIDYVEGYPTVVNEPEATAFAAQVAAELVGEERVVRDYPQLMGSEDFAYMLQVCSGALIRIGNGPASNGRGLHNPGYDFHDGNLAIGAALWCRLAERFLR